eukprot:Gb_16579 [translate_table: standard]
MMDEAVGFGHKMVVSSSSHWEKLYRPLPFLFLGFGVVWFVLVCVWTFNTWSKRHCQNGNLQWMLTIVPFMKALVLGLSFLFCSETPKLQILHNLCNTLEHQIICNCAIVSLVLNITVKAENFHQLNEGSIDSKDSQYRNRAMLLGNSLDAMACFVAFLLISHGYCIMHEQLSASERRTIAGLTSLLYLTLTGYKAAVPQFARSLQPYFCNLSWSLNVLIWISSFISEFLTTTILILR